ncbi:uncharacterized protein [Argopecten irradians]|uniref:uncharacterized protein n=1 Tax=Argopecten irradians TaxID=31199 RepID=UPI00371821DC
MPAEKTEEPSSSACSPDHSIDWQWMSRQKGPRLTLTSNDTFKEANPLNVLFRAEVFKFIYDILDGETQQPLHRVVLLGAEHYLDNIYLVDTPGFGENEQVTKSLVKYLPKALGIIFILNTTVSHGIAEDRGVLILDEIKRLREEGKIPSFDPTKILFVANKWDQVPQDERQDHWQGIIEKMKTVWPHFQKDQLLPLSVTFVSKTQSGDHGVIFSDYKTAMEDYQTVLDKIRTTVKQCANIRSQVHKKFLIEVCHHMKTFVDAIETYNISTAEEKKMKIERSKRLVADMESAYKKAKQDMDVTIEVVQRKVSTDVFEYLKNPRNENTIFRWSSSNMPKGKKYEDLKEKARVIIRGFIAEAIRKRIANSQITIEFLISRMLEFTLEFNTIQKEIELLLKNTDTDTEKASGQTETSDEETESGFNKAAIATIVATSPLWIPLGLAAAVTVLPIGAAVDLVNRKNKLTKYKANPEEHLSRWSEKIIQEEYSKKTLRNILFRDITTKITEELTRQKTVITNFKSILKHLEESKQADVVQEGYNSTRRLCDWMDKTLNSIQW